MLLSRVADALYWISRYLERAEHTARLIDVARRPRLDRARIGRRLAPSTGCTAASGLTPPDAAGEPVARADAACFDLSTPQLGGRRASSPRARTRARCARRSAPTCGSSSTRCSCACGRLQDDGVGRRGTHYVSRVIIEGVHLFAGHHRRDDGAWRGLAVPAGRPLPRARGVDGRAARRISRRQRDRRGAGCRSIRPTGWRCCGRARRSKATAGATPRTSGRSASPSSCCSTPSSRGRSGSRPRASRRRCGRIAQLDAAARAGGRAERLAGRLHALARLRPGRRDPERRSARLPRRHRPPVRADSRGAVPELHRATRSKSALPA